MEKTLSIIKPDGVKKNLIGAILNRFEQAGFKITEIKLIQLTVEEAGDFYEMHRGKPFFDNLVSFMTSGPCMPFVIEGENAIKSVREIMGATNPDDANMGDQDIMLNFFGGEKEKKHMIANLKRLGYRVGDVSGYQDHNFDPEPTKGDAPPQIHSKDVDGKLGKMKVALMIPVQKDRSFRKLAKQYRDVQLDEYKPISLGSFISNTWSRLC